MKKVTSKQNVAIIVLAILLLISIGFGVTYSYFNGRSAELTNNGSVTLATLSVEINGFDTDKQETTQFSLHTKGTEVVPGQPLSNTALQISNSSPVDTYMVVVYSLHIVDNPTNIDTTKMEAMDIQDSSVGDGWRKHLYTCNDTESKINFLVYLGGTNGNGSGIFTKAINSTTPNKSLVLGSDCLKVPESWNNDMQGKEVTLSFTAYIIQADAIANVYPNILDSDVNIRTKAIAETFVAEFAMDTTTAPEPTPPVTE